MPKRNKVEVGAQVKVVGPENTKEELRRVRNRLSQRAIRERRAIRIRELEQELAQARQSDSDTRFDGLRIENEKLRNGLHMTRKKLLSISTTTSSIADSIRTLLKLDLAKEELKDEGEVVVEETPKENPTSNANHLQESPSTEEIINEQHNSVQDPFPEQFAVAIDLSRETKTGCNSAPTSTKQRHSTDLWETPEAWIDESLMDQMNYLAPLPALTSQQAQINAHYFSSALSDSTAMTLSSKRSVSNFSDHLEHIFKLLRLSGIAEHFSSAPLLAHTLLHTFIRQCWPVMDHWFQVTNSCAFMKTVIWWQTTKSCQSFLDMPGGYTPTASQLVLSYPCIIDWIPHPTIRNVLVANYENYDIDQIICDMTDSYVVEDEHPFREPASEPLNVMQMVQEYNSATEDTSMFHPYTNITASHLHPQSQFLQVHRIHSFKIDPSFFVKYPGLYDATAIAGTSCSSIRIHERMSRHRLLPFGVKSANAYLDAIELAKANGFR